MTAKATRSVPGPRIGTLTLAGAVIAATALALLPSPVVLRALVVFPVLVLIAGRSAVELMLDNRKPVTSSAEEPAEPEPILRAVLPVLLGMLSLLAVVLLLAALGIPIDTVGVAAGTGLVALVLLVIARWRTLVSPSAAAEPWSAGRVVRRVAGPAIAAVVLAGAVAGAVALRPVPVEQYSQLALDEPGVVAGQQLSTKAGTPVALPWTLRGYGSALSDTAPAVHVTVGGAPATGLTTDTGPVRPDAEAGVVDERLGTVSFTAPTTAGRYDVVVTVGPATSGELVVQLEVTP
jgi:hypothetical protein